MNIKEKKKRDNMPSIYIVVTRLVRAIRFSAKGFFDI